MTSFLRKTARRRSVRLPGLLAVLPLMLSACSPFTVLNRGVPSEGIRLDRDIAYGSLPRQRLDVYAPRHAARAPVVVFFYGGSWRSGSRQDYAFVGDALASRGILTMIADYRLYPEAPYPLFLQDSAQAVAWALRHAADYGGDAQRVVVAGHSAGAYNAAMVALDARWLAEQGASPAELAGWIGMAGPYDFLPIETRDVRPVFHYPDTPPDSQPLAHASSLAPPGLLMAGTADPLVDPVRNTAGLARTLQAEGASARVIWYPQLGHRLLVGALARPLRWRAPVLDDLAGYVMALPPQARTAPATEMRRAGTPPLPAFP